MVRLSSSALVSERAPTDRYRSRSLPGVFSRASERGDTVVLGLAGQSQLQGWRGRGGLPPIPSAEGKRRQLRTETTNQYTEQCRPCVRGTVTRTELRQEQGGKVDARIRRRGDFGREGHGHDRWLRTIKI